MRVPLREVLALPSFRAAGTRVLCGDPDGVMVRWVHSSEVFEMGTLLAGGEVLLTTGLGLHGRTATHLEEYVDQLADADLAALGLELGRTFFDLPAPVLRAAERRGLCVLALPRVVPFERMVEDFHDLVLRRRERRSPGDGDWRDLVQVVVHGFGLRALLDEVSRAAGCPVELRGTEGQTLERSRIASVDGTGEVVEQVRGHEGHLGTLHLRAEEDERLRDLARDAALAVALELGRGAAGPRPSRAQSLLADLTGGVPLSGPEVEHRLAEQGWPPLDGRLLVPVALAVERGVALGDVVRAAEDALRLDGGPVLAGVAGDRVVAVVRGWTTASPQRARAGFAAAAARLDDALPGAVRPLLLAGRPVGAAGLGAALGRTRELLESARRDGRRTGVVLARDLAVPQLLSAVDPALLAALGEEQVGALIEHDRAHRSELLRTLDAYLAEGRSKARAAEALGIRRQSLYERLVKVERLLGASLSDPDHLLGLHVGLAAWRWRTGLDPRVGFGGE